MTNEEIAISSQAAAIKYSKMSYEDASLIFAFELHGYIRCMVRLYKMRKEEVLSKILDLADTVERNKE
jgi:hypothetical protein